MACIGSDGNPTTSGIEVLHALSSGFKAPEEIAENTGRALFRVRSGLRQLVKAGLVSQSEDLYALTGKGKSLI